MDNDRYMHLSGKIGGFVATANYYDRLADKAVDVGEVSELRARAAEYRQRAEEIRTKRGPRRGHWRQRLKKRTGKTC